ncbi:major facilitator superfamily transporter [Nannizzia gypsea CBS 118893]|uniref:Major facilitator superfamily transporter n=1 Tax=Arthroderma gypseum (strain ATCC MYA-4604 / CBS 118893) TaxID=535722 RepID=E4UVD5_ARTGP|nr:major facilitator superfamily transporter [Nannizzia gypsea CBS 118893]EFR02262.1 major facilitator superfamily transporter [Nannizzia gypsea CBS 118893]
MSSSLETPEQPHIQRGHKEQNNSTRLNSNPISKAVSDQRRLPDSEQQNEGNVVERYPQGIQFAMIATSLCLTVFLTGLDTTIIATAIPKITDEFGSVGDIGWYGAAFRLASCMSQLLQGRFFAFYSVKWLFLGNFLIFEAGVLISGLAQSSIILILGRAVSGLGLSGIAQGCMVIVTLTRPLNKRPVFLGAISTSEFTAMALGPLLGGVITSQLSWRWCFFINIPLAAIPTLVVALLLKLPPSPPQKRMTTKDKLKELDFVGMTLFSTSIFCLLLALQWGGAIYAWSNRRCHASPKNLTAQNNDNWGCLCHVLSSSEWSLHLLSSLLSGFIISYVGYYKYVLIPAACVTVTGSALMTTFSTKASRLFWITALTLFGIGEGAAISSPFLAAQSVLNEADISIGMAIMSFCQDFGEALFVGIAQATFISQLQQSLRRQAPQLDSSRIITYGATQFSKMVDPQYLPAVREAYNEAIQKVFYLSLSAASCVVIGAIFMKNHSVRQP